MLFVLTELPRSQTKPARKPARSQTKPARKPARSQTKPARSQTKPARKPARSQAKPAKQASQEPNQTSQKASQEPNQTSQKASQKRSQASQKPTKKSQPGFPLRALALQKRSCWAFCQTAYLGVSILQPHACTQRFRLRILRRTRSNAGRTSAGSLSGRI